MTNASNEEALDFLFDKTLKEVCNTRSDSVSKIKDGLNQKFEDRLELIRTWISENRQESRPLSTDSSFGKLHGTRNENVSEDGNLMIKNEQQPKISDKSLLHYGMFIVATFKSIKCI